MIYIFIQEETSKKSFICNSISHCDIGLNIWYFYIYIRWLKFPNKKIKEINISRLFYDFNLTIMLM